MDFSKLYEYDDIKFENKHVKILNEKKEIIFEDNIEFPINFDDNSAAIVASRYLCNDSKNKETSIKQMFTRVSDTITTWGCHNKYFDSNPDLKKADEFNSKLRYYQIHKYFAFNSPVYFNVGLQEVPQSSACFILGIEDDMNSITELGKLEAKIFKKGSGVGSNLSVLRSSKESVSGGGKASGPVSFLRFHDVLAGIVKSGGTLRRSAKLSCLNINHPDIEEFIDCKLFEEEKLAILKKSGLTARDGHDLSDEVFFQNTNLSVRVTDDFMDSVEKDSVWNTKFIKSGKICKTYKARDLLKKIAETSWMIADPGLQFHDTFNKWNTLANVGEIVATNPCGEFASLNDTSCNLASLNLLKFFSRDKDNKIAFDYKTFEDVIRTVITAQDILIDNSSYPNDKITINSKKYRNLGLGYTNLGGLLMWLGIPYDSDEGRSLAASLTAAMTAIAYETSADLADKIGPFEGFEENKTSLIRVLNQHYEALNNYSVITNLDTEIKTFASNTWTKVIKRDKFRNAQVSLLAPTGCLKGDSYIITSDGLQEIKDISPTPQLLLENIVTEKDKWKDINLKILQENTIQTASKFYYNGIQDTLKITSEDGYQIEGTYNHRIRIVTPSGDYIWKRLDEININDQIALRKGGHEEILKDKPYIKLNIVPNYKDSYYNRVFANSPEYLDERLAFIIGCYMGDGTIHDKGLRSAIFNGDGELADLLDESFDEVFNVQNTCLENDIDDSINMYFNSKIMRKVFEVNNFIKDKGIHGEDSSSAFIPKQILQSKTSVLCAFLRGLFDTDGSVHLTGSTPIVEYSTTSEKLSRQLQISLLSLGIGTIVYHYDSKNGFTEDCRRVFKVRISSVVDVETFKNKIGFTCERKSELLENHDIIIKLSNFLRGKATWADFRDHLGLSVIGEDRKPFHLKCSKKNEMGSLYWAEEITCLYPQLKNSKIENLLKNNILITRVENIEKSKCETFDISVPVNNTYVANGFISHNTISFIMNSITTGIEPEFSLIRYKRLAGSEGATIKIVNPIVEESLRYLGYNEIEIPLLIKELTGECDSKTPSCFRNNDKNIFLTAAPIPGTKLCIDYMGHVKMCAAVQPFLSGAISKCVSGDTLIHTEHGLIPIENFYNGITSPDNFEKLEIIVDTIDGFQKTDSFYYNGFQDTIKLTLKDGRQIQGTKNHKILIADGKKVEWKELSEINPSDFVAIKLGSNMWSSKNVSISFKQTLYGSQKTIKIPTEMNIDLAKLMGYAIADGYFSTSVHTLIITKNDKHVLDECKRIIYEQFELSSKIRVDGNGISYISVTSKSLLDLLNYLGCSGKAGSKEIPWSILQSSEKCVRAFISGIWLDGYITINQPKVAICLKSKKLINQLQIILNNFGIMCNISAKYNKEYNTFYYNLDIRGNYIKLFSKIVQLDQEYKLENLTECVAKISTQKNLSTWDNFPCYKMELIQEIKNVGYGQISKWNGTLGNSNTTSISWSTAKNIYDTYKFESIQYIIENNIHFVPINKIEMIENVQVYDFHVPSNNSFIGNGIINHNTINLPKNITVDEIYNLYIQAWKMGLKGITIYRDGSKNFQPLTTDDKNSSIEAARSEKLIRKKLPDERPAITHKFRIGSSDGYITCGLYPDTGKLGEIFVNVSKEGSTLSGFADALATVLSIAIQYGVPVKEYVRKLSHLKFEPNGFTSNPDIRIANSMVDYIARYIGLKFLPKEDQLELGLISSNKDKNGTLLEKQTLQSHHDQDIGPACPNCGNTMRRLGSCYFCNNCSYNTGSCG